MMRLQIVDHNINIGHCKVYSTDFVTNILWFIKLLNSEFRIPNSEFRIPNSEFRIPNSEFRIPKFEFRISKKNVVYRKLVFEDDTSVSVHGVGPFDLKLEQFKQ